ncbi:MAG: hypothetical protein Q8R04_00015 [Nanoarchaeota archaeon]|nr:hypothetical protein [Nanoarchaeota archaeon]
MDGELESILGRFRTGFELLLTELAEDIRVLSAQPRSESSTKISTLVPQDLEFPRGDIYYSGKHYYFGYQGSPANIEATSAKGRILRYMLRREGAVVSEREIFKAGKSSSVKTIMYILIRDVNAYSTVFSLTGTAKNGYTLKAEKEPVIEYEDESSFERHGDIHVGRNRIYVGRFAGHAYLDGNTAGAQLLRHFVNNIGIGFGRYELPETAHGGFPEEPLQFLKRLVNLHSKYYELVKTSKGYMLRNKSAAS